MELNMTEELLQELKKITPEEQKILSGTQEIEKSLKKIQKNACENWNIVII